MDSVAEKSYTSATSETPLLGDTIGENLDRTAARYPDRLALVDVCRQAPGSATGAAGRGRRPRPRPAGGGHREGRPRRHLGAELRRVDPHPVRHRQARRDPGQHQPGLPDQRARVRAQPVGLQAAGRRAAAEDLRLRRDDRRGPPALRRPGQVVLLGTEGWQALLDAGRKRRFRGGTRRDRALRRRADQHPVHLGDHRASRRARPCPTTTSSTTASSSASSATTRPTTRSASRSPSITASAW